MNSKFLPWVSLKTRVTLFTLAIFLISLWSLAFYASRMLREDMQQQLGDQQFSVVSLIAKAVDDYLGDRTKALEQFSNSISPQTLTDTARLQQLLLSQPVLHTLFNGGLLITNRSGTPIAEALHNPGQVGFSVIDREVIASALEDGRSVIGSPVMSQQPGVPIFGIAVPIRDADGRASGALVGVIALQNPDFLDHLTQSQYGKTGSYFLVAPQERLIIAATRKERVMQQLRPRGAIPAIDRFIDGFDGSQIYLNPQRVEVLNSAKRLQSVNWGISASIATAEAFAPIQAMQQRMIVATLLLTLAAGLITLWMLRRQLSPILETADMLARMSASDALRQPLPIVREDEIGQLIGGFNHLLGTLAQREAELKRQVTRFSAFLDALPNPIFVKGNDTVFIACNTAYEEAFGISREMFVGRTVLDLDYIPQAEREAFQAADLKLIREGGQTNEEISIAFADGVRRTALYQRRTFDPGDGEGGGMLGLIVDISGRKQAEDYERFRNHILEMLAGGAALRIILLAIVRGIEKLHPAMRCSILRLDDEGRHLGRGIAPSLPDFFNAAISGVEIGVGVGSCGTAAFTGERVVVEDIATHPYWVQYKDLAARAGLGACWSQPIRSGSNRILGTFAIYHHATHQPTEADIALIEQSARLASITIEKCLAEERLRDGQAFIQGVLNSISSQIAVIDETGVIVSLNEAWRMFSRENSIEPGHRAAHTDVGTNYLEMCDTANATGLDGAINARTGIQGVLDGRLPSFSMEYACHSPNEQRWFFMTVTPLGTGDKGAVIVHTNISERKRAEEQIRNLAYYDSLTLLPNRRLLNDRLAQALANGKRTGLHGALMLLDLDNFKPLNDEHGHAAGDQLLIEVARRLSSSVRQIDTVARLGGDEFVVILGSLNSAPSASREQALAIAEKIRTILAQPYFLSSSEGDDQESTVEHHCSASIGVTLFNGQQAGQNEILKHADIAMYQAKEAGRNTIRFFEGSG
ncbi:diguanylate cyclase domain-containing protein [Dechloromonas denitrificans]|uniref:sensor domain-containing diguanylate cyclase n=1 Tax=Dechloromonas denitrificans TaxID=281362 RepID=UPI001CFC178B|nr:diguanylate cyclase [Dechloromonas denitrificans]UCV09818.1 diguanylate cyclase [Dechloromonas denitrificans]